MLGVSGELGYWTDNGAYYYFYGKPPTKAYVNSD